MNRSLAYPVIFFLSFIILSLEILLAVSLGAIIFSPFFALSIAFLGLSAAGVGVYLGYIRKNSDDLKRELPYYICLSGLSLLFYTASAKAFAIAYRVSVSGVVTDAYRSMIFVKMLFGSCILGSSAALVFFFLGIVYCLIYKSCSATAPRVYFFDLLGASCGCIFGVAILNVFQLSSSLILLAFLSFLAVIVLARLDEKNRSVRLKAAVYSLACLALFFINTKTDIFESKTDKYSFFDYALNVSNYEEVWHRWNAYSRVSLLVNKEDHNEECKYIFSISDGHIRVLPFRIDDPYAFKLFSKLNPVTLGFMLDEPKNILILMAGAGRDMIEAYSYSRGASDITGVELNPLVVKKARELPGYNLSEFFSKENVHMVVQEARNYIESTDKKFDSIILSRSRASELQYLGISSYTAQHLFTKEAFKSYLRHLVPGGTIGIYSWNKIKIIAMVKEAFRELGVDDVSNKVIIVERRRYIQRDPARQKPYTSDDYLRVLVKNSDFTKEELSTIEANMEKMQLDWVYNPYYTREGFEMFERLLKSTDTESFVKDLSRRFNKNFRIPKDDIPFIVDMFSMKKLLSTAFWRDVFRGEWQPETRESMFSVFLLFFIVILSLAGFLFVILPLIVKARQSLVIGNFHVAFYFSIIGLGFIFTELALIQSYVIVLGSPIYAFSIVLAGLLAAASAGSFASDYLFSRGFLTIRRLALITCILLLSYFVLAPFTNTHLLRLGFFLRLVVVIVLILPVGLCLGMFFPQGLKRLCERERDIIPWAWGLNGYMTIIGSGLSLLLSRTAGVSALLLIAACLYLLITVQE